jgi:Immunity protein 53
VYGVKITTLDNPGWSVSIALNETDKQDVSLARIAIDRTDEDWIHCWVAENRFEIACGPRNLSEAVQLFVEWFNSN